ncbi:hypothetical protein V1293_000170 [Bradyrhizobium sp. AZCC 1693]
MARFSKDEGFRARPAHVAEAMGYLVAFNRAFDRRLERHRPPGDRRI